MSPALALDRITKRLLMMGVMDTAQSQAAVHYLQANTGSSLITYLLDHLDHQLLSAATLAWHLSQALNEPLFDLDQLNPLNLPAERLDEDIVRQHHALPIFARGQRLFVAMSDPTCLEAIDAIQSQSRLTIQTVIVNHIQLNQAIDRLYSECLSDQSTALPFDCDELLKSVSDTATDLAEQNLSTLGIAEVPVVKFVQTMLADAVRMGASDLHFEPYEHFYRVRFRIDGVMHEIAKPPLPLAANIAARLKVMSQMNITERRVPQDGRLTLKLPLNKSVDFRVNALPTLFGEKIALRILDPASSLLSIDALGLDTLQKQLFLEALHRPQGMILITGPTGSGKTVSLYTGLDILNTSEANISSVEDPVEINLAGINQVNVNIKVGLSFAAALRSFLRQDPDIVMVGEIRDLETADIAIKAAQTGHLVLSTLHTNSAPETLTRLHHMGVPYFNIATSIRLVIAQRLARRLCSHCKIATSATRLSLLEMGFTAANLDHPDTHIYDPVGCYQCRQGYKGRIGLYEVMSIDEDMAQIIMQGGNALDIKSAAINNGFRDLRSSGIAKVLQGIISVQEMSRLTPA